jgi:hypothetical protein
MALGTHIAALALVAAALGGSGCLDFDSDLAAKHLGTNELSITVTGASRTPNACANSSCHVFQVNIVNKSNTTEAKYIDFPFNWEAVDASGGIYEAPRVEGPSKLAPGGSSSVKLTFSTSDASLKFTKIHIKTNPHGSVAAAAIVPSY